MKLYDKDKLKNSRIFFDKRPPKFMTFLVYFTVFSLLLLVVASNKIKKNYVVKARGQIADSQMSYVSSNINGTIKKIKVKEGDFVKKGEVILNISNGEENTQRKEYEKILEENINKKNLINKFRKSLDEGKNYLKDSGIEQEYYGKVEYYIQELNSEKQNKNFTNKDIEKKKNKLNEKISEKNELSNSLGDLEESINYYNSLVKYYENLSYEIFDLENEISQLKINESSKEKDISKKESELKAKKIDYRENSEVQKKESETELKYQETKSKIEALDGEIESLKQDLEQLERQNSGVSSQSKQIYYQFVNEIGNELKNIEKIDSEIKMSISVLEKKDQNYEILASRSGYIHYINSIKEGMNIQINQTIAEISNLKDDNYYVDSFINVSDISKVKKGQDVDVAIVGVNTYKYGTLKGKITSIENGLFTVQTQEGNNSFYKATIEIEDKKLSKDDEEIPIILSMPVESRIIYDKETYLDYFLEKLSFKN